MAERELPADEGEKRQERGWESRSTRYAAPKPFLILDSFIPRFGPVSHCYLFRSAAFEMLLCISPWTHVLGSLSACASQQSLSSS